MTANASSWEIRLVVGRAIQEKYSKRQHDRDEVLTELMCSLLAANPRFLGDLSFDWDHRDEDAKKLLENETLWQVVESIVECADYALVTYPDDGLGIERWRHESLQTAGSEKRLDQSVAVESLTDCAENLFKAEWANSPTLELWLVRKMIFAETFAFSSQADVPLRYKSFAFWWLWTKSAVTWLVGLAVAVTIGETYGMAVGVLAFVAWLALTRYLADDNIKRLTILEKTYLCMKNAYDLSLRSRTCPIEVEKAISSAEDQGAVWPAGLRSLIQRAIARNGSIWR